VEYINYCRNLNFDEDPDYRYIRSLFQAIMKANNYQYDYQYDWLQKSNNNKTNQEENSNKESLNIIDSNKKIPQNNIITSTQNNFIATNNINLNNQNNNLININSTIGNNNNLNMNKNSSKKVNTRMSINNSNANIINSSSNLNLNFNIANNNNTIAVNFNNSNGLNKVNSMTNITTKNTLGKKNISAQKHTINTHNLNYNQFGVVNSLNTKTSASATKINRNFPFEGSSNPTQKNGFNYAYNVNQLRGSNGFNLGNNNDLGPKSNKNTSMNNFKNTKI